MPNFPKTAEQVKDIQRDSARRITGWREGGYTFTVDRSNGLPVRVIGVGDDGRLVTLLHYQDGLFVGMKGDEFSSPVLSSLVSEACGRFVLGDFNDLTEEIEVNYGNGVKAPYIRLRRDTDAIYARRGGTADAGSLIQLAIDDAATAGEQSVFIPPGLYSAPLGLDMRSKTQLSGAGMAATGIIVPVGITAVRAYTSVQGGEISRASISDLIIRFEDPNASGAYRGIHLQSDANGRVWKFGLRNVQIYGAGSDAIYIEGSASNSVAECDFRNLEIARFKGYGIYENIYTFDQYCSDVFLDGGGRGTNYGYRIDGGSGVYHHVHAVACGTNDSAGTVSGGSFRVNGHYNQLFACHSDRPAGHGFVIGGYGSDGQMVSNDFHGCLSFNPGVTYNADGTYNSGGTKVGSCWKIGKVSGLHIIGGQTGSIGSTYAACNKKAFVFEAAETAGVVIRDQVVKNINQTVGDIGASVPTGQIAIRDTHLRSCTGTTWSDAAKLILDNITTA